MRIMGEPHKIDSQLFGPVEQRKGILETICASAPKRRFFMNADATQKNRSAVQQDIGSFGFNTAETNLILQTIGFSFDHDLIKLRIGGCPKREAGIEVDTRKPIRIRSERFADSRFRNPNGYFLVKLIPVKLHPTGDPILRSFL